MQKVSSVAIGHEGPDQMEEAPCLQEDETDLIEMISAYREQQDKGKRFVHVRNRNSSNRDLKVMQKLMGSEKLYSIGRKAGDRRMTEIGEYAESVVTNSASPAKAIEMANCETCQEVDDAVSEEVKRQNWDSPCKQFEQHMKEEDEVRVNWLSGKFEKGKMVCETCGDKNGWD